MPSNIDGSDNFDSSDHNGLGYNQAWQDVGTSRALDTEYTNTTSRPIVISIGFEYNNTSEANTGISIVVDGVLVSKARQPIDTYDEINMTCIVPVGSVYEAQAIQGTPNIVNWAELREVV